MVKTLTKVPQPIRIYTLSSMYSIHIYIHTYMYDRGICIYVYTFVSMALMPFCRLQTCSWLGWCQRFHFKTRPRRHVQQFAFTMIGKDINKNSKTSEKRSEKDQATKKKNIKNAKTVHLESMYIGQSSTKGEKKVMPITAFATAQFRVGRMSCIAAIPLTSQGRIQQGNYLPFTRFLLLLSDSLLGQHWDS